MIELSISERLEHLREQIHAQCISYGEIAELESLREHVPPDDAELHAWAGTPESEFRAMNAPICPNCGEPIELHATGWWSHVGIPNNCWRLSMDGPEA